mmetsp:Transcript_2851/g.9378  ORF Transcript_2851/g.9378 Transcript_2851/m.9378 type:complete len:253 (+) Transcript_2851:2948-3706(+)
MDAFKSSTGVSTFVMMPSRAIVTLPLYSSSSTDHCASRTGAESAPVNFALAIAGEDGHTRSSHGGASPGTNRLARRKKSISTAVPSIFSASGSNSAVGFVETRPDPRKRPPSTSCASALCNENAPFFTSTENTALADLNGTRSYAATAPSCAAALIASSLHAISVPGLAMFKSSSAGTVVSARPVNTGCSKGPEQYKNPFTLPATGRGIGRTPSVSRSLCTSTGLTCALSLYSPPIGFKSRSPVSVKGTLPK